MLAVTGLVMMYIAVFNGRDGENIFVHPSGETLTLLQQQDIALNQFPDGTLVEFIGPKAMDRASVFRIQEGDTHHMLAVDPYRGVVIDTWNRRDGWYDLMSDIHGTLLIGDTGDRFIEIASSFAMVLIITGLYLWWPRGNKSLRDKCKPALANKGRAWWKSLHEIVGLYSAALLVIFLLTGLAWAGIWGGKFVQPWSSYPAEKWKQVPLSDKTHASMNHGAMKDVPWALEQTPMPASGSQAGAEGLAPGTELNVASIAQFGVNLGFSGRSRIHYPKGDTGVWTISQDSMSNDAENPMQDRTVHIDQYTGKILADIRYNDYSLMAKSLSIGVAFHEGDMGLWNLVLNTVFCLGIIFLCVSGIVMWWLRRPSNTLNLAAPPVPKNLPLWKGAVALMLFVSLAFPLVGITLLVILAIDVLIIQNSRMLSRVLS